MNGRTKPDQTGRIMVVGPNGLLGRAVIRTILAESDTDVIAAGRTFLADQQGYVEWSSSEKSSWKKIASDPRWLVDTIINCAAKTNVDACETERDEAWKENVELVEGILTYARKCEARVIQISTDNVFDGENGPYDIDDRPEPVNYYGRSKLAAENLCRASPVETCIVRTMWLYATTPGERTTYSTWVRESLAKGASLKIAEDEIGNPTTVEDLAWDLLKITEAGTTGTIHAVGSERMNRLEWATIIADINGLPKDRMKGVKSADLGRAARRPLNSGMINAAIGTDQRGTYSTVKAAEEQARVMHERALDEQDDGKKSEAAES